MHATIVATFRRASSLSTKGRGNKGVWDGDWNVKIMALRNENEERNRVLLWCGSQKSGMRYQYRKWEENLGKKEDKGNRN